MHLFLRQPFQGVGNVLVGDFSGLFDGFSLTQFGKNACRGNGAAATEGLEFYVFDFIVLPEFKGEPESVAAGYVSHFSQTIGIFYLPDIAGI
jgi:hypothetical protein